MTTPGPTTATHRIGRGPWGAGFPLHIHDAIAPPHIAPLRAGILGAIALPPLTGRMASSKSFSFLAQAGRRVPKCTQTLQLLILAFRTSAMHAIAVELLGDDYVFMVHHCSVRHQRVEQGGQALGFHVDGTFLGSDHQALNFWVPLDDVGGEAPGLTFLNNPAVSERVWEQFQAQQKARSAEQIDPNTMSRHLQRDLGAKLHGALFTPRIRGGDALLFDNSTLHATQDMTGCSRDRVSIEFRVCGRTRIPEAYVVRGRDIASVEEVNGRLNVRLSKAASDLT